MVFDKIQPEQLTKVKRKTSHSQKREPFGEIIFQTLRFRKVEKYVKPGTSVLDLGCGYHGLFLQRLSKKISLGIGYDISVKRSRHQNIRLFSRSVQRKIGFQDNFFNTVTALALLEHLENPISLLVEAHRVLRTNGTVLITTPAPSSKKILEFLARLGIVSEREIADHKHYYKATDLKSLLREAGFRKILVEEFEFGFNLFAMGIK